MKPFFSNQEKLVAAKTPRQVLKEKYERSERRLDAACKTGSIREIKKAMKTHHTYEYALLYQTYAKNK